MTKPGSRMRKVFREGYRLAYFFLVNREQAKAVANRAAERLPEAIARQDKRFLARAESRKKVNLDEATLYMALVMDEVNQKARELDDDGGVVLPTSEYISRYLLHAVQIAREHPFLLAISLLRIVHSYRKRDVKAIYQDTLRGDFKADVRFREVKADLMVEMEQRFVGLLHKVERGLEDRFESHPVSETTWALVKDAFKKLTVWTPDCHSVESGFNPRLGLRALHIAEDKLKDDPDLIHPFDVTRLHILCDPLCRELLIAGCSLPATRGVLSLPPFNQLFEPPPECTALDDRLHAPELADSELDEIEGSLTKQKALRTRWAGGTITLRVDGHILHSIRPGSIGIARGRRPRLVSNLEIWGEHDGQPVLLGYETVNLIGNQTRQEWFTFDLSADINIRVRATTRGSARQKPMLTFTVDYAVAEGTTPALTEVRTSGAVIFSFPIELGGLKKAPREQPHSRGP